MSADAVAPHGSHRVDRLGRPLRDLRISVTDRCNFRCRYCMPREVFGADFAVPAARRDPDVRGDHARSRASSPRSACASCGSPAASRCSATACRSSSACSSTIDGVDIALTTNGSLLAQQAQALVDAGLQRVTVSLDSLDDAIFRAMNDADFRVERVLEGIDAAAAAGLRR